MPTPVPGTTKAKEREEEECGRSVFGTSGMGWDGMGGHCITLCEAMNGSVAYVYTLLDRATSHSPHHTTVCRFRHRPIRHFICPLYADESVFVVNSTPCLYISHMLVYLTHLPQLWKVVCRDSAALSLQVADSGGCRTTLVLSRRKW